MGTSALANSNHNINVVCNKSHGRLLNSTLLDEDEVMSKDKELKLENHHKINHRIVTSEYISPTLFDVIVTAA